MENPFTAHGKGQAFSTSCKQVSHSAAGTGSCTHIPTTPAAAKIHSILSYPVWNRQKKHIKKEREYSHRMNREAVLPFGVMESVQKSIFSPVLADCKSQ